MDLRTTRNRLPWSSPSSGPTVSSRRVGPLWIYIRLLFAEARKGLARPAGDRDRRILRYWLVALLTLRAGWLFATRSSNPVIAYLTPLASAGTLIGLACVAATVTGAVGLVAFRPLPLQPYQRFWSSAAWFRRSWVYPLLSLHTPWTLVMFTALLGVRGAGYFAIFYGVHLLAQRSLGVALGLSATVALVTRSAPTEFAAVCAVVISGVIGVVLLWTRIRQGPRSPEGVSRGVTSSIPIAFRKELAYHRTYTSDVVHAVLSLAVWGGVMVGIASGSLPMTNAAVEFVTMLAILPFTRVLLNLLGMDSNALRALVRHPASLQDYLYLRLRAYALVMYGLSGVLFVCQLVVGGASLLPQLTITALVAVEAVVLVGFYTSVYVYEEKEVAFRYGQHLQSRSVYSSVIVLMAIGSSIHVIFAIGGIGALAAVGAMLLYLNTQWLRTAGVTVLERRRRHLIRAS